MTIVCTLYKRFRKNQVPEGHTKIVRQVKERVKSLPCLGIQNSFAPTLVETYALDIGYGGILKQKLE